MPEYVRVCEPMECDFHRHMPPSVILAHCLSMMQCDFVRSGCGRGVLQKEYGAVWMINSMRIFQYSNICVGDAITYKTFPRIIDGKKYVFYIEIYRGAELILRFDTNFIAVREAERKIIPVRELERHWSGPAYETARTGLVMLVPDCEFTEVGGDTVRVSDCDSNHHMTSAGYLSMACDALGFWNGDPARLMREMQVDFLREVRPGTRLSFRTGAKDGKKYMQGVFPDGSIAFNVCCEF